MVLFFTTNVFACALCRVDIPMVFVNVIVTALPNKTHFHIKWDFHPLFVSQLTAYDKNHDGIYEEKEKRRIQDTLEVYIAKYNYLANITYTKKYLSSSKDIVIKPKSTKIVIKKKSMYYAFDFDSNFVLKDNHILKIMFKDSNRNFNFRLKDVNLKGYKDKYIIKILSIKSQIILSSSPILQKRKQDIKIREGIISNEKSIKINFLNRLSKELAKYKNKIKNYLNDIKYNNTVSSYIWLLFFSFVYGIIHAIGPGHGKTLVGSYFLSNNSSLVKAFNISLLIGIIHTFSAFFLTIFIYFVLHFVFSSFITNIEYVATKVSAVFIISIALYLIYKKFKTSKKINAMNFTAHNPNISSCGCHACNTKSEDLGVILAAGIVPCPGTVTIFIFTFGLGIYYVGFLSAVFMSLGMSLIIFITAFLSINIRKKSSKNNKLTKFFEYGSLIFILLLGLFLFVA